MSGVSYRLQRRHVKVPKKDGLGRMMNGQPTKRRASLLAEFLCAMVILELVVTCGHSQIKNLNLLQVYQQQIRRRSQGFCMEQTLTHVLQGGQVHGRTEFGWMLTDYLGKRYFIQQRQQALVLTSSMGGHFVLLLNVYDVDFKKINACAFQLRIKFDDKNKIQQYIQL